MLIKYNSRNQVSLLQFRLLTLMLVSTLYRILIQYTIRQIQNEFEKKTFNLLQTSRLEFKLWRMWCLNELLIPLCLLNA
ncbi:unnamed protein product [Schistosoma margrebowiei]|uniref:Uncharacterized protein n=1 Tax=Schistosoma margrebowiei TaxID=48269 RepID=A0A183LW49_9TREM|nr:unnamed protein product [Schistosoma margrebowiei]